MLASVCVKLCLLSGGGCQSERQQTCNRGARDYTIGVHKPRLPAPLCSALLLSNPICDGIYHSGGHKNLALV